MIASCSCCFHRPETGIYICSQLLRAPQRVPYVICGHGSHCLSDCLHSCRGPAQTEPKCACIGVQLRQCDSNRRQTAMHRLKCHPQCQLLSPGQRPGCSKAVPWMRLHAAERTLLACLQFLYLTSLAPQTDCHSLKTRRAGRFFAHTCRLVSCVHALHRRRKWGLVPPQTGMLASLCLPPCLQFLCPISLAPMAHPVRLLHSGHCIPYDRQSIEQWLATGSRTDPLTGWHAHSCLERTHWVWPNLLI